MGRYLTPLRYPGGKQRLTPFVEELLETNNLIGGNYVEPYAGGAGVGIELLLRRKVRRIYLNDSSRHIYAFWYAVKRHATLLSKLVRKASLSIKEWERQREIARHPDQHDLVALGFSTFYLNRCNRSGVLTAGVIGGKAQEGKWLIGARFSRNELARRIDAIAERARDITVANMDAEKFMVDKVNDLPKATFVYCDPPYYARARRLYLNIYRPDDHVRVASVIQNRLIRPWIVSYDADDHIERLYKDRKQFRYSIMYSAMHSYAGTEVFIFSDRVRLPATSSLQYLRESLERRARIK
jgi:DNA adenine methylase